MRASEETLAAEGSTSQQQTQQIEAPASEENPPLPDLRALLEGEDAGIVAFCLAHLA